MKLSFSRTSVLVTGASWGLGLAISEAFLSAGATTHMLAEDPSVVETARERGGLGHVADISDGEAVAKAMARIEKIDVLVNNAGLERMTPLDDDPETEQIARRIIEINVLGTGLVTRRAIRLMQDGGAIINTASIWGRVSEPMFDAYVASKHAIIGLTKTWARELGPPPDPCERRLSGMGAH